MTEIMPVPRNLSFTVLPAGGLWAPFFVKNECHRTTVPPCCKKIMQRPDFGNKKSVTYSGAGRNIGESEKETVPAQPYSLTNKTMPPDKGTGYSPLIGEFFAGVIRESKAYTIMPQSQPGRLTTAREACILFWLLFFKKSGEIWKKYRKIKWAPCRCARCFLIWLCP